MLILSRKAGERIRIGDDIEVVVLEVSRDQIRIGINAPRSVSVHREEIYQDIITANRLAADGSQPGDEQQVVRVARFPGAPHHDT